MIAINMEMPTACMHCPLFDGEYGTCNIIGETKADASKERAENCPLTEIVACNRNCEHCGHWHRYGSPIWCPMFDLDTSDGFYCANVEHPESEEQK